MATDVQSGPDQRVLELRRELPATASTIYLNAGTNGPIPTIVQSALTEAFDREVVDGRIGPMHYPDLMAQTSELRSLVAGIFGADPDEVALTRSTTEGLNIAIMGVDWQRGDEIITTNLEHICLFSVLGLAAYRHGVVVKTVDIGDGDGDVYGAILDSITPRTRMIAISHLQWSSGAIMPVRELAEAVRRQGILTVVDGAQSAGQIEIDFHELGVDAYAIAGQKWLCGPSGTGALFVRRDRLGHIRPTYLRHGRFDPTGFVVPPAGAARFEMGEFFNPALRGQRAGLLWLRDTVGLPWLTERVAALGRRCWDGLASIPGTSVCTPGHAMAGLICFTLDGWGPSELSDELYRRGYTIRFVEQPPAPTTARISTGWWNTEDEVDGLIAEIAEIASGPASESPIAEV